MARVLCIVLAAAAVVVLAPSAPTAGAGGSPSVVCLDQDYEVQSVRRRPRTCHIGPLQASNAERVDLSKLKWSSWGGRTARAKGLLRVRANKTAVTVTLSRPRPNHCGPDSLVLFTRAKLVHQYGSATVKISDCASVD